MCTVYTYQAARLLAPPVKLLVSILTNAVLQTAPEGLKSQPQVTEVKDRDLLSRHRAPAYFSGVGINPHPFLHLSWRQKLLHLFKLSSCDAREQRYRGFKEVK